MTHLERRRVVKLSKSCCGPRRCGGDHPHALLHLARHVIVAHDSAAVAQATGLSLHHEHPECVTGLRHQGAPCLLRRGRSPERGWAASNSCSLSRAFSSAHPIRPSVAASPERSHSRERRRECDEGENRGTWVMYSATWDTCATMRPAPAPSGFVVGRLSMGLLGSVLPEPPLTE